jgi:ATP-dependent DNA helicase RecG
MQLIDGVWREIPDFRESYELPDGLFRQHIPVYDGRIVRELLVNALVHRPYTQRGDIYLNLRDDQFEIVNPGLLPLGVTPQNILHQSVRRNNELARVFHDLGLMEREGVAMICCMRCFSLKGVSCRNCVRVSILLRLLLKNVL